ncbi:hypothetical protein [Paucibacter soli]|uniref:hypothetical protein n=1 Tax=Paucibacter soli TaxID=3133433 RepID=UPI00309B4F2C
MMTMTTTTTRMSRDRETESVFHIIDAWRALRLEGDARAAWCSHLRHLKSSVSEANDRLVSGVTLWGAQLGASQQRVGIAWAWLRMGREVVALADPMQIRSNACLVGTDDLRLPQGQALLHLNNIVNALPWQAEVLKLGRSGSIGGGPHAAAVAVERRASAAAVIAG